MTGRARQLRDDLAWLMAPSAVSAARCFLLALAGLVPCVVVPFFWATFMELLVRPEGLLAAGTLALLVGAFWVLTSLVRCASARTETLLRHAITALLHRRVMARLDEMDASTAMALDRLQATALFQRDAPVFAAAVAGLPGLLAATLALAIMATGLWFLDQSVLLMGIIGGVAVGLVAGVCVQRLRAKHLALRDAESRSSAVLTETLLARDELVLQGALLPFADERFRVSHAQTQHSELAVQRLEHARTMILQMLFAGLVIVVLHHVFVQTRQGALTVLGGVFLSDLLLGGAVGLVVAARNGAIPWQEALASRRRLRDFIGSNSLAPRTSESTTAPNLRGDESLHVEHLMVSFASDKPVLQGASFTVECSEWVAISGPSGEGKTTLLRTLAGLVQPLAGEVRLGDSRLSDFGRNERRRLVAMSHQEASILSGTLRENLLLAAPGASDEEMRTVLEDVALDIPLSERIGKAGRALSGGESQRLGVARLFLRVDARIWLLDEPTAPLDEETERRLLDAIERRRGNRCVLMVTHSPQGLAAANRSLRLEGGCLWPAEPHVART